MGQECMQFYANFRIPSHTIPIPMGCDAPMSSATSIAASGMQAATAWLGSIASNLANMRTDGPVPATPPSQPVPQGPGNVYQATTVQQTADAGGGVSTQLQATLPSYLVAFDPSSPMANSDGQIAQPNVDEATQVVGMIQAGFAFRANAAVIKAADGMVKSLLDIVA
jgi:flagellar basal-body rod protein FlgC